METGLLVIIIFCIILFVCLIGVGIYTIKRNKRGYKKCYGCGRSLLESDYIGFPPTRYECVGCHMFFCDDEDKCVVKIKRPRTYWRTGDKYIDTEVKCKSCNDTKQMRKEMKKKFSGLFLWGSSIATAFVVIYKNRYRLFRVYNIIKKEITKISTEVTNEVSN